MTLALAVIFFLLTTTKEKVVVNASVYLDILVHHVIFIFPKIRVGYLDTTVSLPHCVLT